MWLIEAVKYNVLPLDDRFAERASSEIAARPELIKGNRQLLYGGMGRLTESSIINYKNKSYAVTAEIVVPETADGVIVAVGGLIGGWSLYTRDGKPKYCYNFFGIERFVIEGSEAMSAGTHQVRMEFVYDGGGIAKGGDVTLFVDGQQVGAGRVENTEPFIFSSDETCDIGFEAGSPVIVDYEANKGRFNGEVNWVEIDVGEAAEDDDHYITDEERYRVAMAIQ